MGKALQNKRIVIAGSQKTSEMSTLIEKQGGTPLIRSLQGITVTDDKELERSLVSFVQHGADWVVFTTGIGAQALWNAAEKLGILAEFELAVSSAQIAARGYKTHGFLKKVGLRSAVSDEDGTISSLVEMLSQIDLQGQRVLVQLHGEDSPELSALLDRKGAEDVHIVLPYRHTPPHADTLSVLVRELTEGAVDAVCFTTRVQVHNLFEYARQTGQISEVQRAFATTVIAAAVGRVTAEALHAAGIERVIAPETERMGALIVELARHFDT